MSGADRSPVALPMLIRYVRARSLCARALTHKSCLLLSSRQGCCMGVVQGCWALLRARRTRRRPEVPMPVATRRSAARLRQRRCHVGPLILWS